MAGNEVSITVTGRDSGGDAALRGVQQSLGRVESAGKQATQALTSGFQRAGERLGQARTDTRQAGAAADELAGDFTKAGKAAKDAGDEGESFGKRLHGALAEQAQSSTDGLAGKLGNLGSLLGKLGPIGLAAGATLGLAFAGAVKAVDKLHEAVDQSIERTKVAAHASAQLGLEPAQVAALGRLTGKIYADNFGESVQDAATSVRDVIRNKLVPADAVDDVVKKTSERLLTVANLFEDSTSHVASSVGQLLRTGLAKNADEAFDVMTRGLQLGADKAEDLLDTLNEYPTQLRKLGLDAKEATGLLVQGLQAGARDSDIVADALKEFSIRAVDGSTTTADGFKRLGLNGKKMAEDIAAGGDRANAALDKTLDRLRGVKDPVQQAQIAVELFGTQAEDLGKALYALDPSSAVNALGQVDGAADKASTTMSTGLGPQLDTIKRKFETWETDLGDKIAPVVGQVIDKLSELAHDIAPKVREALDYIHEQLEANRDGLEKFKDFLVDMEPFVKAVLIVAIDAAAGSIGLLIKATAEFGETWARLKAIVGPVTAALLSFFGEILHGAVEAFGWIPGIGPKLKEAEKQFDAFARSVNNKLDGIPDQQINVNVRLTGLSAASNAIADLVSRIPISQGIGHRATGGVGYGLTVINEQGQEAVRLPTGSTVIPHGQTQQLIDSAARGGSTNMTVVSLGGSDFDLWLLDRLRDTVRGLGGDPELIGIKL